MAKMNKVFVAISLILIFSSYVPNRILCKPTGRNSDLIDGNDFLSLFLDQEHHQNTNDRFSRKDNHYKSTSKSSLLSSSFVSSIYSPTESISSSGRINNIHSTSNNVDLNEEYYYPEDSYMSNEEELLTQDTSHYGQRLKERMPNQKVNSKTNHNHQNPSLNNNNNNNNNKHFISSSAATAASLQNDEKNVPNNLENSDNSSKKQIIKMVTSGSKIIFLDEKANSRNSTTATTPINISATTKKPNSSKDVQVISVSVSSTVGRSRKQQQLQQQQQQQLKLNQQRSNVFSSTSETIPTTYNSRRNHNVNKNDFINRSHKSEFSIEESEPVTQTDSVSDSVNGESTNIHSILAAPNNKQDDQQSKSIIINQSKNSNIMIGSNANGGGIATANHGNLPTINNEDTPPVINRMQRKQDKLVPFQTVIYHDSGFNKNSGSQHRSVSYSSVGQSIDQLNDWKDLEGLLEVKQNVSESLKKPQLLSSLTTTSTSSSSSSSSSSQQNQQLSKVFGQADKIYSEPAKFYSEPSKMYGEPSKFYSEPSKIYSEPAKVYGQPEKIYGEPSKVYSEPSKIYSEPAKIYSEPAKVYGEPSKVYWPRPIQKTLTINSATTTGTTTIRPPITTMAPASSVPTISSFSIGNGNYNAFNKLRNASTTSSSSSSSTTTSTSSSSSSSSSVSNSRRVIFNLDKLPYDLLNAPESSKRLLVPELNTGQRLSPSINIESKNNNNNNNNNNNDDEENDDSIFFKQPQHHHYYHQHFHNAQEIDFGNNGNNNRGRVNNNGGAGSRGRIQLQNHHASSSSSSSSPSVSEISTFNNRPLDLVTDKPNFSIHSPVTSINTEDFYTPTPEQNYEIEESVSVMTNGRANGIVRPSLSPTRSSTSLIGGDIQQQQQQQQQQQNGNTDDSKVGYVVEGRNFRKYRVEEKTDDGFIVGEYGVVSHNDGGVRGVRYTADSNINPSLIHQALMKFLSL